ncbi:CCA tRNA nucleotidyltransferase, mitochondrial [Marasmius crinis-equi]|uniref:CCA tRNA nucleotidyltransferase, mitochondrial n=1 Tax=Marasmius crinis-equi TaxID=585013 RepID=A0ABR3G1Q0_9AGAR
MAAFLSLQTTQTNRIAIPEEMKIELTETEEKICVLLDKCTNHLRENKGIHTECRIAGGWVRDKLLGSQSNDIDVALTDIMGYAFAEHLAEFARAEGMEVGTIGKIAQNPDQSKHLETATFSVLGRSIDLVNLRSEEYASGSRIPTGVTFGTPEQDALRRDITINALFYNCHTRLVEDCTKKGLDDLENGVVRTPLPPKETFIDDPLRVLRCIRFASRFGFDIVPEIVDSVRDPEIKVDPKLVQLVYQLFIRQTQEALVAKVARERAGEELSKMVKGRNPLRSVELIASLNLYSSIFSGFPPAISDTFSSQPSSEENAMKAASILQTLLKNDNANLPPIHPTFFKASKEDETCTSRLFLAAVLTPYAGITYRDHKKKELPVVEYVIRDCLKLGSQNHFLDGIPALFFACQLLRNPDLNDDRFKTPSERAAIVQELVPFCDDVKQGVRAEEAARIIGTYNTFIQRVEELGLHDTVDAKYLIDGREVSSLLDCKPGPWTGGVLTKVLVWQLENPRGTKEECSAWLKSEHERGNLEVGNVRPNDAKQTIKKARTRK